MAFYLQGREALTIATYNSEYKKLVEYYRKFGKMVCVFGERDVISYVIWRSKQGVSEAQLKQVSVGIGAGSRESGGLRVWRAEVETSIYTGNWVVV